jgi:hypothetical protein
MTVVTGFVPAFSTFLPVFSFFFTGSAVRAPLSGVFSSFNVPAVG